MYIYIYIYAYICMYICLSVYIYTYTLRRHWGRRCRRAQEWAYSRQDQLARSPCAPHDSDCEVHRGQKEKRGKYHMYSCIQIWTFETGSIGSLCCVHLVIEIVRNMYKYVYTCMSKKIKYTYTENRTSYMYMFSCMRIYMSKAGPIGIWWHQKNTAIKWYIKSWWIKEYEEHPPHQARKMSAYLRTCLHCLKQIMHVPYHDQSCINQQS